MSTIAFVAVSVSALLRFLLVMGHLWTCIVFFIAMIFGGVFLVVLDRFADNHQGCDACNCCSNWIDMVMAARLRRWHVTVFTRLCHARSDACESESGCDNCRNKSTVHVFDPDLFDAFQ